MKPLYIAIIVIIAAAGAFFGGMQYQKTKSPTNAQFAQGRGVNGALQGQRTLQRGNTQGFRPVNGEIISQDDTSITVKSSDGSTKIVMLSETTAINKSSQGSKQDLQTGQKVAVFGKENSDGSVTAQNIQLNPGDRMMMQSGAQPDASN